MATNSDKPLEIHHSREGIVAKIPHLLVMALVTALASGGATRCGSAPPEDLRDIRRDVSEIKTTQRTMIDTMNKLDQEARNRDTVQDAKIEGLRNR